MDSDRARREALRVFRWLLAVRLALLGLGSLAMLGLGAARWTAALRLAPTLLLALLVLPRWFERALGRRFLALALGVYVLIESLLSIAFFFDRLPLALRALSQLEQAPPGLLRTVHAEPFFFLLIPLVLLAWGYGRRGALWGSGWASFLHLATGYWARQQDLVAHGFWVGAFTRVLLLFVVPLIVGVLAERERREHAQLELAHQRLRRHAATVEQLATSRERNRLARDLHDTLAHSLSALAVQLEALRAQLAHEPQAAGEKLSQIAGLAHSGLDEARRAIQALRREPVQALGLDGALREVVDAFQARTGVQASLTVAGGEPDLTTEESAALFRIAEEALANIERHASAAQVAVRLDRGSDRIDLVLRDDGLGFDPRAVDPAHYGLAGMRERAELIGAALEVHSRPGGGTEIRCSLPR
jgi:signal transduction histidine kinase